MSLTKEPLSLASDEFLMQQICAQQSAALEILYNRYFDKLTWFASGYTKDLAQAEDLVQEVFMKIIEQPHLFNSAQKFSTWVYTLTANRCKNQLRNHSKQQELMKHQPVDFRIESHSLHDYEKLKSHIKLGLLELSEKEKAIFTLRFHEELSLTEIAKIIQIPEGSVKSGLYYLLKKLSKKLSIFIHDK
ncbi:MAG: RNA polymerase sigma factor [bacterium]|nr:RNA polymerase sigma factor [bacterium]